MKLVKPENLVVGRYYMTYRSRKGYHKCIILYKYAGIFTTREDADLNFSNVYEYNISHGELMTTHDDEVSIYEFTDEEAFDFVESKIIIKNL